MTKGTKEEKTYEAYYKSLQTVEKLLFEKKDLLYFIWFCLKTKDQ